MAKRIRRVVAIAASANVDDQLTVDGIRLSQRKASDDGICRLMATQSAVGLRLAMVIGSQVEASNLEPRILATAPLFPDDVIYEGGILGGDDIALQVLNTTAGILTLSYDIEIP